MQSCQSSKPPMATYPNIRPVVLGICTNQKHCDLCDGRMSHNNTASASQLTLNSHSMACGSAAGCIATVSCQAERVWHWCSPAAQPILAVMACPLFAVDTQHCWTGYGAIANPGSSAACSSQARGTPLGCSHLAHVLLGLLEEGPELLHQLHTCKHCERRSCFSKQTTWCHHPARD